MSPGQRSSVAEVGRTAKLPSSLWPSALFSWFFSPGFFSSTSPLRPAQPHLDPSSMLRDLIFLRIPPASVLCFANALYSKTLAKSHIDRQKHPFKKKNIFICNFKFIWFTYYKFNKKIIKDVSWIQIQNQGLLVAFGAWQKPYHVIFLVF